jgi:hypothetical protein
LIVWPFFISDAFIRLACPFGRVWISSGFLQTPYYPISRPKSQTFPSNPSFAHLPWNPILNKIAASRSGGRKI